MESEEAVLKLVHPGRFVEIHRHPVAASEVMAKNPRHFVTRPDVFRFPWIVIRPESLLKPGNVFYIVPSHTLYRLLQAHRQSRRGRYRSPPRSSRHLERLRPSPIDPWAADAAVVYSKIDVIDGGGDAMAAGVATGGRGGGGHEVGEARGEEGKLKSCLKKKGSSTRPEGRRVNFALPDEEEDGKDDDEEEDDHDDADSSYTASSFFSSSCGVACDIVSQEVL